MSNEKIRNTLNKR